MELDALEEFNRRVDEVLHYLWDPIGVAGKVMARDEYTGYVPTLMTLLKANAAAANTIADYLTEIRTEHMELGPDPEKDNATAKVLLQWKAKMEEAKPRILG
jgi:hypothetical protein